MTKHGLAYVIIAIIIIAAIVVLSSNKPIACTQEALICHDGSAVGRIQPDCRFAPCPDCTCPEGFVQDGDTCNPECYYSNPKCLAPSLSCSAACKDDSDCIGTECCHPTSCMNKVYRGVCNLLCTDVCQGPLDCGAGSCQCINKRCAVTPR